ncbi:MAG TPA: response regulator transcription factor [Solirubrobacteraceae bacterium]|nr:response regulator transcription factor [Solirubrobacteraceae bacterium]
MAEPRDRRPISVVLCDDVAEVRSALHDVLAPDPSIVIVGEADNGRDCLHVVGQLDPDIVVIDLSMPEMDGFEAIPALVREAPRTGIIAISGLGGAGLRDTVIGLGADHYLEKESGANKLAAVVTELARVRAAAGFRR